MPKYILDFGWVWHNNRYQIEGYISILYRMVQHNHSLVNTQFCPDRTNLPIKVGQPPSAMSQLSTRKHPAFHRIHPIQHAQMQMHVCVQLLRNYHANFEYPVRTVTIRNDSETSFSNFNGLIHLLEIAKYIVAIT